MDQKIAEFLKKAHPSSTATTSDIKASKDLFSDGFLDSMLNLKLLAYIEKEENVKIPPLEVTRNSFKSVPSIVAIVNKHK